MKPFSISISIFNRIAVGSLALLLGGCASPTPRPAAKDPSTPSTVDLARAREFSPTPSADIEAPSGPLTLNQTLDWALARNPALKGFGWEIRRAEAMARQAGRWSNPELEFELENFGGEGAFAGTSAAESTLSLAQTLPLGNDAGRRRALARLHTERTNWDYEAARIEVLAETARRFIDTLAAEQRLAFAQRELALAEATARVANARVEAGEASPIETMRVVVPVVTAEVNLERAERELESARRRLSLSWDGDALATFELAGDLEATPPLPAPSALLALINQSPAVARWATEVSARVAERNLARAEAFPDLTARLGLKRHHATDASALVVGVSLPLPLFDRRQGDRLAARHGESSARERQRAAELRLEGVLSDTYAVTASALAEANALRDRALPAASQAFGAIQQGFREGKRPFLEVLDAQRTFFELQQRTLDALVAYHHGTIALESLLGQPLSHLNP